MHRRWSPGPIPRAKGQPFGPNANIIHACSDTLRRYCESLWYSGLEYKRPTDEEILAKCGILFYKKPIPTNIMYAFYYQLDNMFTMSKVVHTIRSITDWLDATENRAFQVLSIYEMYTQIPNFVHTIADHLKALKICAQLLPHLGSIYHRVRPLHRSQRMAVRAVTDFQATKSSFALTANQCYCVQNNWNPHLWQLTEQAHAVPSLFLEASTEFAEHQMLKRLQDRFEEFLVMCHGRSRRHLHSRLSKQLKSNNKCATLPTPELSRPTLASPSPWDGHYFAKSPQSTKRWRSFSNSKVLYRQPALFSVIDSDDVSSASTIAHMMSRLRRWLHHMPSPATLINSGDTLLPPSTKRRLWFADCMYDGDEVIEEVCRWWRVASLFVSVADSTEIDRIVNEACFLKSLNDILQTTVDIGFERNHMSKTSKLSSLRQSQSDNHPNFTKTLIEELSSRLGEPFYHPRSGRTSYRWIRKSIDRSKSSSPPSASGAELVRELHCTIAS